MNIHKDVTELSENAFSEGSINHMINCLLISFVRSVLLNTGLRSFLKRALLAARARSGLKTSVQCFTVQTSRSVRNHLLFSD